jgi:hypothetical protein
MRRFLATPEEMEDWLRKEAANVEAADGFFSHWVHSDGRGFGLVISGATQSGEFHLMPDGDVSAHVERFDHAAGKIEVIWNERRKAFELHGFEEIYASFKRRASA